jgi:hypothetical protein
MNRNFLVSVFCALLFASTLANAKDIEGLIDKCARGDRKACEKLKAAVEKLTDQALLAKIAVEDTNADVRYLAVKKLTDQAVLAKIAVKDREPYVRRAAVQNLTDQAALAKVAVEDKEWRIRDSAVEKLTDQALLAKIAVEATEASVRPAAVRNLTDQALLAKIAVNDKDPDVREAAVEKLTDQALLAKIAVVDENEWVRRAAVEKLTDQALLAKIAVNDKDSDVREAAVEKLTDQALLAKIAVVDKDRSVRAKAIAAMVQSNPALKLHAGNLGVSSSDLLESTARIRLAIQEPRIRNRLPRIVFTPRVSPESQRYHAAVGVGEMRGESVSFVLRQAGGTLAEINWRSDFPQEMPFNGPLVPLGLGGNDLGLQVAYVHGEDLLAQLLRNGLFTQDDLAELSSSDIPEVRVGAVRNLTDQALLAKIAVQDKTPEVCRAAEWRLAEIRNNAK